MYAGDNSSQNFVLSSDQDRIITSNLLYKALTALDYTMSTKRNSAAIFCKVKDI